MPATALSSAQDSLSDSLQYFSYHLIPKGPEKAGDLETRSDSENRSGQSACVSRVNGVKEIELWLVKETVRMGGHRHLAALC